MMIRDTKMAGTKKGAETRKKRAAEKKERDALRGYMRVTSMGTYKTGTYKDEKYDEKRSTYKSGSSESEWDRSGWKKHKSDDDGDGWVRATGGDSSILGPGSVASGFYSGSSISDTISGTTFGPTIATSDIRIADGTRIFYGEKDVTGIFTAAGGSSGDLLKQLIEVWSRMPANKGVELTPDNLMNFPQVIMEEVGRAMLDILAIVDPSKGAEDVLSQIRDLVNETLLGITKSKKTHDYEKDELPF